MPTYEYKCAHCGHSFEEFQSMTAVPLIRCPQCDRDGLKRVLGGGAGMIFKGQGFYLTDYKKSSGAETPKKKEGTKKESGATGTQSDSGSSASGTDLKSPGKP
ncbi:MAG: hypothetical protein HBSIN02_01270 [Bacteroidia bacterium]|nr:MAG: hypothetical protein HBSIN02_01270 [Bacteroidia bacterium]